jgi:Flp pilus assembly protein TadD
MIRRFVRLCFWRQASAACAGLAVGCALVLAVPVAAAPQAAATDDDGAESAATTSVPVVQSITPSPTRALNAALARLARDPRDLSALLDAGGAALDLGDTDAAIGFLTRADQITPGNGGVRARLGVAMLRAGQPLEAIRWFDLAEQAAFPPAEMAVERGLAYDLSGDNTTAQRHYQIALSSGRNDEASRRYALSLVIAGDRRGAEMVIQPLLERQDRGAWRVRTFIMAISGQSDEAEGIARATMPADLAAAISPYLRYMPRLTPAQQAAAANLGRFPRAADIGRDDPQIAQYALAHPRAPRVDAGLVPQGEALGARGRDDRDSRSKRRRPGKDAGRETALAAATPLPRPTPQPTPPAAPAVSAPWGLQPGPRTAAAPQQATPPQQTAASPAPSPATPAKPAVLSRLDVPPGTPLAPPLMPALRAAAPAPAPAPSSSRPAPPAATPAPAPAPAAAASSASTTWSQLATAAPAPAPSAAAPAPELQSQPQPQPAPLGATPPAPPSPPQSAPAPTAPSDFGSLFNGFKPPEQEATVTTEAVDLARIEALREAAKTSPKGKDRGSRDRGAKDPNGKDRGAKDRGERPDGPTAVSRTSGEDEALPAVTRGAKDARDRAAKDAGAKAAKDKLALDRECLDKKGKPASKGKVPQRGKARSAKGKAAAEAQCPPETGKGKGKAEPAHTSRIWVQVLTGSNRAAMGKEWQRLVGQAPALKSRKPYITPWRSNFRLLTGPFASDAEAQAFIDKLRSSGVSSYEWTSPAGQAVDGLIIR